MPRDVKLVHVLEDFHHPYRRGVDPNGTAPEQHLAPQRHPFEFVEPYRWAVDPHGSAPQVWMPAPQQHLAPPASRTTKLPQHFRAHGILPNAHDFVLNYPQFNEFSSIGSGLEQLLKYSMPAAFHDSGARYPPPKCHLGTRNDYIDFITNWALGTSDRTEPILWMHGPFGVGKSAVAQSCAEALERVHKLAATLFFSRSDPDRDDPQRVFTSITYQIATVCPSFGEIVSRRMIEHPALATKSLSKQFEDLLVQPLRQVDIAESGLNGRVVIIDGLDECQGTAEQCEIIKIIAASALRRTTPFHWFITSRPEDLIIRTMNSPAVYPLRSCIELPVSRKIDHEILLYLTDEFKVIREDHSLPEAWPEEEVLTLLVERCAGLWIYVWTIVRFIKDKNSLGPKDQLRIVLEFAKEVSGKVGPDNPLAEMDFFYTLIMQQVPLKIRTTVQKILLIHSIFASSPKIITTILCLSAEQLRCVCASIQSVMKLRGTDLESMAIKFYHTSFLDFMGDPQRSKDLCIYGDFLIGCRRELLEWLHKLCSCSTGSEHIVFPSGTILPEGISGAYHYYYVLGWFWTLCEVREHPLDSQTAWSLSELPFQQMLRLLNGSDGWGILGGKIRGNLPAELRDKIIRKGKCPITGCMNTMDVWILGYGENEILPMLLPMGNAFWLINNQNQRDGRCRCGAQIQRLC